MLRQTDLKERWLVVHAKWCINRRMETRIQGNWNTKRCTMVAWISIFWWEISISTSSTILEFEGDRHPSSWIVSKSSKLIISHLENQNPHPHLRSDVAYILGMRPPVIQVGPLLASGAFGGGWIRIPTSKADVLKVPFQHIPWRFMDVYYVPGSKLLAVGDGHHTLNRELLYV